ncbi:MAG TPA: DUF1570 domain-containing protein [Planctomycetaceae bacterium]|nr:DUF1570 domain-containing protein [Planctomycetaceae bacterium]
MRFLHCSLAGWLGLMTTAACAAPPTKMLELELNGRKHRGAVVSHSGNTAWFLERDGRLMPLEVDKVGEFKDAGRFRPFSTMEVREHLAGELSRDFQIAIAGSYVVAGPPQSVERMAPLFDQLYRDFMVSFAARGFKIRPPETPLIAVIFPDRPSFEKYCHAEGVRPQPGLRGFYMPLSNRVALYDSARAGSETATALDATILHEATHQVAYNVGIHSRIGSTPKWVVEGLATALEREAMRTNDRHGSVMSRINPERYAWFQRFRKERRLPRSLGMFVQSDGGFDSATLDAYSEAWALTFFLLETRSAEYAKFLTTLNQRDPMKPYPAEERLKDFQAAFGRDLVMLEAHFLRFYQDLPTATASR